MELQEVAEGNYSSIKMLCKIKDRSVYILPTSLTASTCSI
jgi:hypothetical protein